MKKIFFIITILILAQASFAQEEDKSEKKGGFKRENLFLGGNFGLYFSSGYTLVNISPQLGYRLGDKFSAGTGVNFIYASQKFYDAYSGADYARSSAGYVGLNIFGRFYPVNFLALQVQPEVNYRFGSTKYFQTGLKIKDDGKFIPSVLVGAGARLGSANLFLFYDVVQDKLSPYGSNPFISISFGF
jgi:hypothetical protein